MLDITPDNSYVRVRSNAYLQTHIDWLNGHLKQGVLTVADCGGMLCVLTAAAAYLVSGSYNPFLYFRF